MEQSHPFSKNFVPLFEQQLAQLNDGSFMPTRVPVSLYDYIKRMNWDNMGEDEEEDRPPIVIEVPKFENREIPEPLNLKNRKLQVIVKLANIELTPEKPNYPQGSWHVEGMQNESIVASGIYYYEQQNITQSELRFRVPIAQPYAQDEQREQGEGQSECAEIYGLDNNMPLNYSLGSLITQEKRCIAFPNIYQHQVAPFKLVDPKKPGFRKILVFFLVDPTKPVISTSTVPIQQSSWFCEILRTIPPFSKLPKEIFDLIVSFVSWPMSLDEAKKYRQELMAERKFFIDDSNSGLFEREFSLCEH